MILTYLLWAFLAYFLYRFIFNFLIPVIRTARQFRKQVRAFQSQMQEAHAQQHQEPATQQAARKTFHPKDDYIDFEEVGKS